MNYGLRKPSRIVSKKIRQSAAFKRCTLRVKCGGASDGSVVLAHLNSAWKGVANKSPDIFGVYACNDCHRELDAGRVDKGDQLRALMETQMELYEAGLIEVPSAE